MFWIALTDTLILPRMLLRLLCLFGIDDTNHISLSSNSDRRCYLINRYRNLVFGSIALVTGC